MRVIVLGSGGSAESANRSCSSYFVDRRLVIDAGPGSYKNFLKIGGDPLKVSSILITHLHGDHFFDVGAFIWGMSYLGRTESLTLVGPKGVKEAVSSMLSNAHTPKTFMRFEVEYIEIKPGEKLTLNGFNVETAPGKHSVEDIAYRIGGFCYTGDTSPSEEIASLCKNASALFHEATGLSKDEAYLNSVGHSSARQAAEVAVKAKAKKLFLTHFPPALSNKTNKLKAEALKVFKESYIAKDFLEVQA